jgi:DNA-directed RNA polymerase specialized sigma24 family protein
MIRDEDLSAYLDGETTPSWTREIEAALDADPGLVSRLEGLRRNDDAVRTMALSQEHRKVMLLVVTEGLAYRDATDSLDVPIGAVLSRLSRARAALERQAAGSRLRETTS